jgi:outer membrane immunogenic protein
MKKITLALAAATALISAPALAADLGRMPVKAPMVAPLPYFNWTGFYLGIQGGFGWGDLERTLVTTGATLSHETSGGLLGGTVGYNWQAGTWVFGFEADYAWADIGRRLNDCFGVVGVVCSSALESFGTARLRIGGAWDRVMIYGTGGFAFGDHALRITDTVTGLSVARSDFAVGWTAGGGIEWGFAPGWSLKAEALYFDLELDRLSTATLGVVDPVGIDARHTGVIVRGGINYRFNWGGPGVVASY